MQDRSNLIKPSTKIRCREEVAYGWRIRLAAEAELPQEFDRWRHLVDPLEDVQVAPYLYRCPECGRGLPEPYIQQILEGIGSRMVFYFPCDRCKRSRSGKPSAEHASIKHIQLMEALEELDEFPVTWYQDHVPKLTRLPVKPNYNEAVRMMIAEGDAMRAACLAIECHIAHISVPSSIVEDRHVLAALQTVINDRPSVEDEAADPEIVDTLIDAIEDGIDMFTKAMRFRGRSGPHVRVALREIETSIRDHRSAKNPRAYIQFMSRFTPV